ncbi:MAG: Ni/Fe hydrogenase subunit alpha [Anaerolineae bacterium]|nr:Ni/Fe hydrogenase subunit alpha [Anaerolineae bacterium]
MTDMKINVHHITRVEGHGNIVVNVVNGELEQCDLAIVETPRFFEAMLKGRHYSEASHITSRICGICATGHATASLRATENALGVVPTKQTELLRKLAFFGEILDSHILHVYMLVAPDFLGVGSVIPLAKQEPEIVMRALRMKKLSGDLCAIIAGRHTHPIAMTVGGFTHYPTKEELLDIRKRFEAVRVDLKETVDLFESLDLPAFTRETEYIALRKPDEYAFIDGEIASSDGGTWPLEDYLSVTNEYLVPHSSAKHAKNKRNSYMVGALARINVNFDKLHPHAKSVAEQLGLAPVVTNPYAISVAQVVEIVHAVEESLNILDELVGNCLKWEEPVKPKRLSGEGVGAAEVPRGTLFHHYTIEDGVIQKANCVIPTGQNLANIEADMRELVPTILDKSQAEITQSLEMLVRAYDPCISCSAHLLNVEFVR